MQHNLEQYVNNSFSASQRLVSLPDPPLGGLKGGLGTRLHRGMSSSQVRLENKCGISVPIDGSRDEDINIGGLILTMWLRND